MTPKIIATLLDALDCAAEGVEREEGTDSERAETRFAEITDARVAVDGWAEGVFAQAESLARDIFLARLRSEDGGMRRRMEAGDFPTTEHRRFCGREAQRCRTLAQLFFEVAESGEGEPEEQDDNPTECECDNTHSANGTVCRWCWAHGRRKPSDPDEVPPDSEVEDDCDAEPDEKPVAKLNDDKRFVVRATPRSDKIWAVCRGDSQIAQVSRNDKKQVENIAAALNGEAPLFGGVLNKEDRKDVCEIAKRLDLDILAATPEGKPQSAVGKAEPLDSEEGDPNSGPNLGNDDPNAPYFITVEDGDEDRSRFYVVRFRDKTPVAWEDLLSDARLIRNVLNGDATFCDLVPARRQQFHDIEERCGTDEGIVKPEEPKVPQPTFDERSFYLGWKLAERRYDTTAGRASGCCKALAEAKAAHPTAVYRVVGSPDNYRVCRHSAVVVRFDKRHDADDFAAVMNGLQYPNTLPTTNELKAREVAATFGDKLAER